MMELPRLELSMMAVRLEFNEYFRREEIIHEQCKVRVSMRRKTYTYNSYDAYHTS